MRDFVVLAKLQAAHVPRVVEKAPSFMAAARLLGIDQITLYRRRRRQGDEIVPLDPSMRTLAG